VEKRSLQVARQIVRDIVQRGLTTGSMLPVESEMLLEYGVSRFTLREALRLLEAQGLIRLRTGPRGGTEVGTSDAAHLSHTLVLHLMFARSSLNDVLESWLLAEPLLARMAAANPDRTKVAALMKPFIADDHQRQTDTALEVGLEFHDSVAELAGDQLLGLVLGVVHQIVHDRAMSSIPDLELSSEIVHSHADIARCILEGDEDGAHRTMRAHILDINAQLRQTVPTINLPIA